MNAFSLTLTFKQGNGLVKRVTKQFRDGASLAAWYEKCRPGRLERDLKSQSDSAGKS